jgi:hypothetical protein
MAGWVTNGYPGGSVNVMRGDDFPWKQNPCKLILHTTETVGFPNYSYNKAPQVTVNPRTHTWQQHRRLDQPAWALQVGPVSTNSMGAVQIEIVGYAASVKDLGGDDLAYLIGFIRFILAQTGIPDVCTVLFGGSETSGLNGTKRMSVAGWTSYRGICGHQHVPGNSHWDPGDLPMQAKWLPLIQGVNIPTVEPKPEPEPEKDDDMFMLNGGQYRGAGLFGPASFKSLTQLQVDTYIKAGVKPPIAVSESEFDAARDASVTAQVPPVDVPPADVDEQAIADAVIASLNNSATTLSDADVQKIVAAVKELTYKAI